MMRSQVSANNAEAYIACGLAGLGLIQMPAFDVRDHPEAGELVEALRSCPAPSMPVQIVYTRTAGSHLERFETTALRQCLQRR